MAKQLKNFIRTELTKRFKPVDGGLVITYRGVDSEKMYDLRAKMQAKGVKLHIVKNTLALRAFTEMGYDQKRLEKLFEGPVGVIYAKDKKVGAAGAAKAFIQWQADTKDKVIEIKGGFMDGSVFDAAGAKALKDMPSREQMLAILAGTLQAPIAGLAGSLKETYAKFAYAIDALKTKQEGAK